MSLGKGAILIIISLVLLLLSSFFSAAETAYSSITKFTIEQNLKKNKYSAKLIKKHYKSFGWVLATILLGNNLVNVGIASISTLMFAIFFDNDSPLVTIVSIVVITPIIVVIGEIIPKLLAKRYAYGYLSKVVYIIEFLSWVLFPITYPFSKFVLFSKTNITEKEVKDIAHLAARQKEINDDEALIVSKALELNSLELRQIMVKKQNFVNVNANQSIVEALNIFQKSGHSRLPVIKNNRYIGILMLKNILFVKSGVVEDYCLKVPLLSKNMSVTKALELLRSKKTHIAFVVNVYKTKKIISGLVTLEDIFEEIFGEIYDEHDQEKLIHQVAPNKWIVDGSVSMSSLASVLHQVSFDEVNGLTVKQWVQKRSNKKIRVHYKYIYKKIVIFRVIFNKQNQGTKFEVRQKLY